MIRHFLRDDDLTETEQAAVLGLAATMKANRFSYRPLEGPKSVALLFDKPSTRTRVSFTVGVAELGGQPVVLEGGSLQLNRGEDVIDTVRSIDAQVFAVVWRTFLQSNLEAMAQHSRVPVINALSDDFHPCQLLADLLTIREHHGDVPGRTLAYFGDISNNMAHSYLLAGALAGMHVRLSGPEPDRPRDDIFRRATDMAQRSGGSVEVIRDAKVAAYDADVIATDTWCSMGDGPLDETQLAMLRPFTVDEELLRAASPNAMVLHCLPAYRGLEITSAVLDGPRSAVRQQAENRLHVQKALLSFLLESSGS